MSGVSASKSKRVLKPVSPEMGIAGALEWLADSFRLPEGFTVAHIVRHGKQKTDAMTMTLASSNGQPDLTVRFAEQRDAARPDSLRLTLASETNGVVRMSYVGLAEASDVYTVMCLAANEAAAQDVRDETQGWLDAVADDAHPLTGWTLQKDHRYDTLMMLRAHKMFDRRTANALAANQLEPGRQHIMLVDSVTGWRYLRAGEVAAYIRHLIGPPPMSQPTLDARLAEIGVDRVRYEERRGRSHPSVVFYVLPDVEGEVA